MRRERPLLSRRALSRLDDLADLQAVALGEGVVALVVRRHTHDRAGPVLHQHVVGDPDRDALLVDRVQDVTAGGDAVFLLLQALDRRARAGMTDVLEYLGLVVGALHQLRHERMLGREHEEGRAEQRVGPGREDHDLLTGAVHAKVDVGALGPSDPVPLHGQNPIRPLLELGHLVEQGVRVVRDLEEPLLEVA